MNNEQAIDIIKNRETLSETENFLDTLNQIITDTDVSIAVRLVAYVAQGEIFDVPFPKSYKELTEEMEMYFGELIEEEFSSPSKFDEFNKSVKVYMNETSYDDFVNFYNEIIVPL